MTGLLVTDNTAPKVMPLALVTVFSDQAGLLIGLIWSLPLATTVLEKKTKVALAISVEVMPSGKADRSNLSRALVPLLTLTAEAAPVFDDAR